jgi:hypothetical protein
VFASGRSFLKADASPEATWAPLFGASIIFTAPNRKKQDYL